MQRADRLLDGFFGRMRKASLDNFREKLFLFGRKRDGHGRAFLHALSDVNLVHLRHFTAPSGRK